MYAQLKESIKVKKKFINEHWETLQAIINVLIDSLKKWNKILIAWNGWNAADSQYFAAELIWRYQLENRPPLPALALNTDTSILTSIWNNYGFDDVFSRQLEALRCKWDIFIAISTSGMSRNIIRALEIAQNHSITSIVLNDVHEARPNI